jgi:hypothetical protein
MGCDLAGPALRFGVVAVGVTQTCLVPGLLRIALRCSAPAPYKKTGYARGHPSRSPRMGFAPATPALRFGVAAVGVTQTCLVPGLLRIALRCSAPPSKGEAEGTRRRPRRMVPRRRLRSAPAFEVEGSG